MGRQTIIKIDNLPEGVTNEALMALIASHVEGAEIRATSVGDNEVCPGVLTCKELATLLTGISMIREELAVGRVSAIAERPQFSVDGIDVPSLMQLDELSEKILFGEMG